MPCGSFAYQFIWLPFHYSLIIIGLLYAFFMVMIEDCLSTILQLCFECDLFVNKKMKHT